VPDAKRRMEDQGLTYRGRQGRRLSKFRYQPFPGGETDIRRARRGILRSPPIAGFVLELFCFVTIIA
jgi:hypothetical protein